jgi:hypothetical protein
MSIIGYVRWRRSPAGREAYRAYAQGRKAVDQAARTAGFWARKREARAYRREHPPYNSRRARQARADAALRRAREAPLMVPSQVTDQWSDGRQRVTDYDTRTGRKIRVHTTRSRARDADGMRPRQHRTR